MRINEIPKNAEIVEERHEEGPISDMGEPYPVTITIYKIGNTLYEDQCLDAPWQIGGNSGENRPLREL